MKKYATGVLEEEEQFNKEELEKIEKISAMGFSKEDAIKALEENDWDESEAINSLLS